MGRSTDEASTYRALAGAITRVSGLLLAIVAISLLHYTTNRSQVIWHEILLRLYYVPILIGAYWYGAGGGLLVAVACSMAYVPHVWEQTPRFEASLYAEIVVFHLIGLTVGVIATAQRRVTERYQRAATTLERANRELRDSYEQLQRADRLKTLGEIAAGLAHEVRHPLSSIRGALEIINARSPQDSPEAEFSRLAMAEVQRLDNLVWEFLRYAGPHQPDLRPTSLPDVVERVVALLRVETDRDHVTLEVDSPDTMLDVRIDVLQIEQVLLNVILNAVQATRAGSVVRVRAHLIRQEAVIDVIDEGPGIPTAHLPSIFTPFFTTKEKGTGLGLAIAHRIVIEHHGHIEVCDTSERGTWFRITLPVDTPSEQAALGPSAQVRV